MAYPPPDHRAQRLIVAAKTEGAPEPEEPLERAFFHFVKTGEASMSEIPQAIELYSDEEFKHVLNALTLSGAHSETVAAGLGLSESVYQTYVYLFFDVDVFPHNLAKDRYIKLLRCNEELRKLYEIAIERGAHELIERYRIGAKPRLDPEELMYGAMTDMWSKFLTHRGYNVTSDVAKEALRWGESMLRVAKMLSDSGKEARRAEGAADDLRIALEIRNETKKPAELGIKPEDLVDE